MPTRPEVRLIGRMEKPKTVRKRETPACGLGLHKKIQNSKSPRIPKNRETQPLQLYSGRSKLSNFIFSHSRKNACLFSILKLRWASDIQARMLQRPATLELAVVAAGPRGVPTRPEVLLIGRTESTKTVRKRRRPPAGWVVGK